MTTAAFTAATTTSTYVTGTLFRDMGKSAVTYGTMAFKLRNMYSYNPS
jgi:hypothetical protein